MVHTLTTEGLLERHANTETSGALANLPRPGDLILAYAPLAKLDSYWDHKKRSGTAKIFEQNKPATIPRLCIVMGLKPNPLKSKPPLVQLLVGQPISEEKKEELKSKPESESSFVYSWRPAGSKKTIHWHFECDSRAILPWDKGLKCHKFGGPFINSLDRQSRLCISDVVTKEVEKEKNRKVPELVR